MLYIFRITVQWHRLKNLMKRVNMKMLKKEKRKKKTGPVDILNNFKISNSASISATGIIEHENEDCLRQIFGK